MLRASCARRRWCIRVPSQPVRTRATIPGKRDNDEKRTAVLPASLSSLGLKYLEHDALRARFDSYDTDGSGSIWADEAVQLLKDAGAADYNGAAAARVVHSMDVNHSGGI